MGTTISSVGVVTKNRLAGLKRALSGYAENTKNYGRKCGFVVMDDSVHSRSRGDCRRMLLSLRDRWGVEFSYAGSEEKAAFARALVGEGLPREVVRFALGAPGLPGFTAGANRNALLLHTAGQLVFNPDDDVHCRVAPAPGRKEGTAFSGGFNPEEFWFFKDKAAALRRIRFQDKDVLGLHEEFLGRELSGRGRVLVTSNGLVGDCALASPRPYLRLRGNSRRRLTATRSSYECAESRQIIRAVTRATAGDGFFTSAVGLDNRALLAPFMPMFRNEDGLFGLMMKKCFPRGLMVQLPWALHHAPPSSRTFRRVDFQLAPALRVNDVLQLCAASYDPAASDGERRLRALGDHLTALATAAPTEFRARMTVLIRRARALQIFHLDDLLQTYNRAPKYWAADVRSMKASLERSLRAPSPAPRELASGRDSAAGWESFRRLLIEFGSLVQTWPDLVRAAKELRGRGIRLARPVES